jgi:hypothetical protein
MKIRSIAVEDQPEEKKVHESLSQPTAGSGMYQSSQLMATSLK